MVTLLCHLGGRRVLFIISALLFAALLSACGTQYGVSVDSLRDAELTAPDSYYLMPGNADTGEDDLLFREVSQMLIPAFKARGFSVTPLRTASSNTAKIKYWEDTPVTTLETGVIFRSVPVVFGYGRRRRAGYITVEEPTYTTRTTYSAGLLITAYTRTAAGKETQVWRTSIQAAGPKGNLRTLLSVMVPVLESTLGTRTDGGKTFKVRLDDKGVVSVEALD